jgi:nucleotide-binding universal stress UspA family protein
MAYPTMMVHVDFEASTKARVHLATSLADRFRSTLLGIAACAPHPSVVRAGLAIPPLATCENPDELKIALDQQEHQFRSIAAKGRCQVKWRSALDLPTEFVAREAGGADLVIIGRERFSGDPFRFLDPGALLLRIGRPVLLVPDGLDQLRASRVAVAWKDTREARRALSDSLGFLHDAEKVFLVEVCAKHEAEIVQQDLSNAIYYLIGHRITTATPLMLPAPDVADELLRIVRTEQIDLLVAGAYGHSRLGEWVFGGVTRDLLRKSPICCLFSH